MEWGHCHGKHPPLLATPRLARGERKHAASASFSASLLDTIYRSLDEGGDGDALVGVVDTACRSEEKALALAPAQFWWAKEAPRPQLQQAAGADRRRRETGVARPRHSGYASSTTSSSDSTPSYSFSCSSASTTDTESMRCRHSPPPPGQPEEVADATDGGEAEAGTPPSNKAKKKSRPCFPGARLRPRDASPSLPGRLPPSPATFACVLKALFTSARLPRKPKGPTVVPPPQTVPEPPEPSCTSATPTAKTAERRTVRFCSDAEASVVRRRVEELVRSLGELEEDEEGSDSSSDLFELESLVGANGDELRVYGTTNLVANRAIAQGAAF